jgi:chromosome segregation ATPase
MATDELTNEEVLSLLHRMDTEENTLRPLWDQFTVARRQAQTVIARYQQVVKELPALEQRKVDLELGITFLGSELERRQDEVNRAVGEYRQSLEGELVSLQKDVKEGREKVVALRSEIRSAEKDRDVKKAEMEVSLVELAERLESKKLEWNVFREGVLR